jgi:DNA-3-methyladenine glycosylase II
MGPDDQLREDPVMARLIDDYGGPLPTEPDARGRPNELYGALVRAIAGQQLSVKAAAAIWRKLLERFDGETPTPQQILADDPEALRAAAGFSHANVRYLRSLAEHVLTGQLDIDHLRELPDADVVAELTAVTGIGEWTAQMFLMFTLHRPDVLPVGDLGVRNAAREAYGVDSVDALRELGERWRPHRTRASRYLWRSLANTPV